jgi:hypothetical protein
MAAEFVFPVIGVFRGYAARMRAVDMTQQQRMDKCDCAGFCQEKAGCRGLPRRMAMHNHASLAEKAACLICNPARTHWHDKICLTGKHGME